MEVTKQHGRSTLSKGPEDVIRSTIEIRKDDQYKADNETEDDDQAASVTDIEDEHDDHESHVSSKPILEIFDEDSENPDEQTAAHEIVPEFGTLGVSTEKFSLPTFAQECTNSVMEDDLWKIRSLQQRDTDHNGIIQVEISMVLKLDHTKNIGTDEQVDSEYLQAIIWKALERKAPVSLKRKQHDVVTMDDEGFEIYKRCKITQVNI